MSKWIDQTWPTPIYGGPHDGETREIPNALLVPNGRVRLPRLASSSLDWLTTETAPTLPSNLNIAVYEVVRERVGLSGYIRWSLHYLGDE